MTKSTAPTTTDYRQLPFFSEMSEEEIDKYWRIHSIDDFMEKCPGYFPEYKGDEQLFYTYFSDGRLNTVESFSDEEGYMDYLNSYCHPADDHIWTVKEYPPITTPVTGYFITADWEAGYDSGFTLERGTYITLNSAEDLKAWFRSENNPSYDGDSAFIYWEDAYGHREYVCDDVWADLEHLFGDRDINTRHYARHLNEAIWGSSEYLQGVYEGTAECDEEVYKPVITADELVQDALASLELAKHFAKQKLVPELITSVADYLIDQNIKIEQLRGVGQSHDGCVMYKVNNTSPMQAKRWYQTLDINKYEGFAEQPPLRMFATVLMTNQVTTLLQCISVHRDAFGLTSEQIRQITCAGLELFEVLFKEDCFTRKDFKGHSTVHLMYGNVRVLPEEYDVSEIQNSVDERFHSVSVPKDVSGEPHLAKIASSIIKEMAHLQDSINETDTDRYPQYWNTATGHFLRKMYDDFYDTLKSAVEWSGQELNDVQRNWFGSLHYALECFLYPMQEEEEGYNTDRDDRIRRANFLREFFNLGDRYDLSSGTVTDDGWLIIQEGNPLPPTQIRCLFDHWHSSHFTHPWRQNTREFFDEHKDEILSVPSLKAYSDEVLALDCLTEEQKWDDIYENCSWFLQTVECDGTVHIDPKGREYQRRLGQWHPRISGIGLTLSAWVSNFDCGKWFQQFCFADPCTTQEEVDFDRDFLREQVARRPNRFFKFVQ